jgi:hypothetical protein
MKRKWFGIAGAVAGLLVIGVLWKDRVWEAERRRDWYDTGPPPGGPLTPAQGPVVDNPAPDHDRPSLRLAKPPTMVVGRIKDDLRGELWAIRDALLTETGKLALINPSDELRLFDANGKVLWTKRGRGQGPGDIENAASLANLRGDTLHLFDQRLRRVTVFDSGGGVVRTSNVGSVDAVCCLADGTALIREGSPRYQPLVSIPEHATWSAVSTERQRPNAASGISVRREGVPVPTGVTDGRELFTVQGNDPLISVGPLRERRPGRDGHLLSVGKPRPFARAAVVRAADEVIIYARSDSYEYRVYAPTGELVRIVRAAAAPVPVTKKHLDDARAKFMEVEYSARTMAVFASTWDRMGHPTTMPAFGRVSAENDGTVWIQQHRLASDSTPESWARFDRVGRLLGTVRIPAGMRVLRFTRGHVILRSPEDNDGFVELHVHRVEPAPNTRRQ